MVDQHPVLDVLENLRDKMKSEKDLYVQRKKSELQMVQCSLVQPDLLRHQQTAAKNFHPRSRLVIRDRGLLTETERN